MTQPARVSARDDRPELILDDLAWERVQLLLRVRPGPRPIEPGELRLRRRGGPGSDVMAPTSVRPDGDGWVIRFNVMQGTDLMPLAFGEWRLEVLERANRRATRAVRVAIDGVGRPGCAVGEFELIRGVYTVTPRVDPAGTLQLRVSLASPTVEPPPRQPWTLLRVRNRIIRRLRRPGFQWLYRLARVVVRHDGRHVLFSSDSRSELGGNLKDVYDRMVERGLDRDTRSSVPLQGEHRRSALDARPPPPPVAAGEG